MGRLVGIHSRLARLHPCSLSEGSGPSSGVRNRLAGWDSVSWHCGFISHRTPRLLTDGELP